MTEKLFTETQRIKTKQTMVEVYPQHHINSYAYSHSFIRRYPDGLQVYFLGIAFICYHTGFDKQKCSA